MPEIKQPTDRKKKAEKVDADEFFSFEYDGETHTMPNRTEDVITPGFVRKNRRRDETDFTYTILEALADGNDTILDLIDNMSRSEFKDFSKTFQDYIGASLGE